MPPFAYTTDPAKPLAGDHGRIRVSPLVNSVAARVGGNTSGANRAPAAPAVTKGSFNRTAGADSSNTVAPGDPSSDEVAQAVKAAEAGDQSSIDWLKTIGLIGLVGTGATAVGIARTLAGRKKLGADNIAVDTATNNIDSTSSNKPKALPAPDEPRYLPRQAAKKLPKPVTVYQPADAQPLALPNPNPDTVVTPAPVGKPLQIEDKNAAGRAKAAQAEIEGWRARLGSKFKVNPETARAALRRVTR